MYPQDTFEVKFVINDEVSGVVDNNRNRDYDLPLLNAPTEDQVTESRTERLKAWEKRIHKVHTNMLQHTSITKFCNLPTYHNSATSCLKVCSGHQLLKGILHCCCISHDILR